MLFYSLRLLIAAAVIPAIWLLTYVYKKDRLEKESASMLLSLIVSGISATFCAMIAERIGTALLSLFAAEGSIRFDLLENFIVVALSEEGFKYLFMKKKTWNSSEFNCQFDGVVYAVFVSLGFAILENILYVFMGGLGTALVRAVTAIPGHACFGVFMGVWYGLAKRFDNAGARAESAAARKAAVIVPVLMHGAYDFIASMRQGVLLFIIFVALMFLAAFRLVKQTSENDKYI